MIPKTFLYKLGIKLIIHFLNKEQMQKIMNIHKL